MNAVNKSWTTRRAAGAQRTTAAILALTRPVAFTVALTLGIVACSAAPPPGPTPSAARADFAEVDVAFAQAMIPHGEQAGEMSALLLKETGLDPLVRSLAEAVVQAQPPDTAQLQQWLARHGQLSAGSSPDPDQGGREDGMASAAQLRALSRAEGAAAQDLYLDMMLSHHRGAIAAARAEVNGGQAPELVDFARKLI